MSADRSQLYAGLSPREWDVLELAVAGKSDEQIAQALGLKTTTVSSYWVRIRRKLGHHSRTEIVGDFLRHQARTEHAALHKENQRLREDLRRSSQERAGMQSAAKDFGMERLHAQALLYASEATLITAPPANVVFANHEAQRLYAAQDGDLDGLPMRDLTTAATPERLQEPCRDLFEGDGIEEETVGLDEPYYALRRNGSGFRAVVRAVRFDSPAGVFAVVTVRQVLSEGDTTLTARKSP